MSQSRVYHGAAHSLHAGRRMVSLPGRVVTWWCVAVPHDGHQPSLCPPRAAHTQHPLPSPERDRASISLTQVYQCSLFSVHDCFLCSFVDDAEDFGNTLLVGSRRALAATPTRQDWRCHTPVFRPEHASPQPHCRPPAYLLQPAPALTKLYAASQVYSKIVLT